jgi:hypothetical protein
MWKIGRKGETAGGGCALFDDHKDVFFRRHRLPTASSKSSSAQRSVIRAISMGKNHL